MYEVELSNSAEKQLYKLPTDIQKRIVASLERARTRPHAHMQRLVESQHYRLRVGKYRVIADIQDQKLIILVVEVGHRKSIYK